MTWRFRVPEGETIRFVDGHFGPQEMTAGRDFGDFMVMRGDGMPSYQLSCVVDDAAMGITEVSGGFTVMRGDGMPSYQLSCAVDDAAVGITEVSSRVMMAGTPLKPSPHLPRWCAAPTC